MTLSDATISPERRAYELTVESGATLFVRDWGPADGPPVIHHHGMPGCSLNVPGGWTAADEVGVRVISFDRPGYGRSGRHPGRTVAEAARWTQQIADTLDLEHVAILGTGAGAPHAAAAAAVLGERVRKLCLANGLGPDELPGFDPAPAMMPETRHEIACARAGEAALLGYLEVLMQRADPLEPWLQGLAAVDVELLARREVQVEDAAAYAESMYSGLEGWVEDDLALWHHAWGCDFGAVTARTLLLYGLDDVLVPSSHGDAWLLALGHGQLVKLPEAGHWLRDYEPSVLRWLGDPGDAPARPSL
jgi:pimeloyl-ACP methyl ester carboxylesterase